MCAGTRAVGSSTRQLTAAIGADTTKGPPIGDPLRILNRVENGAQKRTKELTIKILTKSDFSESLEIDTRKDTRKIFLWSDLNRRDVQPSAAGGKVRDWDISLGPVTSG
jgi:hypothetical protein